MPQRLGDDRAGRAHPPGGIALGDVDDPVADVADGPGRRRQVLDPGDREPEIGGQVGQVALGHGPGAGIADGGEGLGGGPFDLFEVVVPLAHLVSHGGVGGAAPPIEAVAAGTTSAGGGDGDDESSRTRSKRATRCSRAASSRRAARTQVRQLQRLVQRVLLHVRQGHLQLGPAGRGRRRQQVGGTATESGGQLVHRRRRGSR